MLPIFHLLLPLIYIGQELGLWPLAFLMLQPIVIFTISRLVASTIAVWAASLAFMLSIDVPGIAEYIDYMLEDAASDQR